MHFYVIRLHVYYCTTVYAAGNELYTVHVQPGRYNLTNHRQQSYLLVASARLMLCIIHGANLGLGAFLES